MKKNNPATAAKAQGKAASHTSPRTSQKHAPNGGSKRDSQIDLQGNTADAFFGKIVNWTKDSLNNRGASELVTGNMARLKNYGSRSPLLVGALGVGVGTILGALLPRGLGHNSDRGASKRRK